MKVLIELPPEFDVKTVNYNEESRTLTLEPRVRHTGGTTTVGYIRVVGDSGREQRSVLRISNETGTASIQNVKEEMKSSFDGPGGESSSDDDEGG